MLRQGSRFVTENTSCHAIMLRPKLRQVDIPAPGRAFLHPGCSGNARGVDCDKARKSELHRPGKLEGSRNFELPPTGNLALAFPPLWLAFTHRCSLRLVSISPRIRLVGETFQNSRSHKLACTGILYPIHLAGIHDSINVKSTTRV